MQLVRPAREHLAGYSAALQRGWSPDNVRGQAAALEELAEIEADADGFLARMEDLEAKGPPIDMPDGSTVKRLPGFHRWMWDGEFAGTIDFRWQPGTTDLPPTCLGHIGYAVVPWKRRLGYATEALRQMLPQVRFSGLAFVELTTDPDNLASQRVVEANGGVLHERFMKPAQFGGKPGLRYRIAL
jgi:predicted acetyltransferase